MARSDRADARQAVAPPPATARASVALPGAAGEVRSFEVVPPKADEGWLQVIASGICGTDVALFARGVAKPMVLGHHVVGRVAALGTQAARRRGLEAGDRVVLEEYLPCGKCETCAAGPYRLCPATDLWRGGRRVGMIPAAEAPGLTGGNAEYTFLPANAVTHRVPEGLSDELAAWVLPYANAIDWVAGAALRAGETVVVLGPGYHGLAVAAAARRSGAGAVVVAGLARDAERLAMAEALDATPVVVGSDGRFGDLAKASADLVVDTVGSDPSVVGPAVDLLAHGGRFVLTHPKQPAPVSFDSGLMFRQGLHVAAVRGRAPEAITAAIESLSAGDSGLEVVPTVEVGLADTAAMLARLAAGTGPESPHVVVRPSG